MQRPILAGATGILALAGALPAVETRQVLTGEVFVAGLVQNNYADGDNGSRDRLGQMRIRASLGTSIELDDLVEVQVAMVYDAEGGDQGDSDRSRREAVELLDGNVLLKKVLNLPGVSLRAGRQDAHFNLRKNYGGFLYDSRADDPVVDRWDGLRIFWQVDNWTISPFWYVIREGTQVDATTGKRGSNGSDSEIFAFSGDWRPDRKGDDRVFLTGMLSVARKVPVGPQVPGSNGRMVPGAPGSIVVGDELHTYYGGFDWKLPYDFQFYGELAFQDGDLDDDRGFKGMGFSTGLEWQIPQNFVLGLQFDYLTGDKPKTKAYEGFVAPWEAVSDTLIVESERYGEISEYLVGDLESLKLRSEWSLVDKILDLRLVGATYRLPVSVQGENHLGDELDLTLGWRYQDYTKLEFFAAIFFPGAAFDELASAANGAAAENDPLILFGASAHVTF